jgi:hypothetical protein
LQSHRWRRPTIDYEAPLQHLHWSESQPRPQLSASLKLMLELLQELVLVGNGCPVFSRWVPTPFVFDAHPFPIKVGYLGARRFQQIGGHLTVRPFQQLGGSLSARPFWSRLPL